MDNLHTEKEIESTSLIQELCEEVQSLKFNVRKLDNELVEIKDKNEKYSVRLREKNDEISKLKLVF